MGLRVKVAIDKKATAALHAQPFGEVHKNLHKEVARFALNAARIDAPVNDPLNALHRSHWGTGKPPGTYKESFGVRYERGSNQYKSKMVFYNDAPHAIFVEKGRSASSKFQTFSWTKAPIFKARAGQRRFARPGWKWWLITAGGENSLLRHTRARAGQRVMGFAMRDALRKWQRTGGDGGGQPVELA